MDVVVAENLSKSYRGRRLYDEVSFRIEAARATRIVGPNGSGKSVLLRLICGFTRPDSGHIAVNQRYLSAGRSFPERFGIVIDRPGFLAAETGLTNLLQLARIRKKIDESRVREVMTSLGLDPDLRQKVRDYSLGMKQKLGIAQALMEHPEVLVLDEPFNALDAASVASLQRMLIEFVADGGTLIYTSHDPAHLQTTTALTLEIHDGTVREQ